MASRSKYLWLLPLSFACSACSGGTGPDESRDFRQDMRAFVQAISEKARTTDADFIVIPQNGPELLSLNGESDGPVAGDYMAAIDGVGREDLFYGFDNDDVATPASERDYMLDFMDMAEAHGIEALVTDYCSTPSNMDDSYTQNQTHGFTSFAADHRDLDDVPAYPAAPFGENMSDIATLADAKNFLYVLDPSGLGDRASFLAALAATDYDLIITDLFYEGAALTPADVAGLKTKAGGGTRLVIAYMSIGEAEDYRYYWEASWHAGNPAWLAGQNPDWPGNYKVRYWDPDWREIILGDGGSYLDRILAAGYDGVYLDIIDAFEYFEGG